MPHLVSLSVPSAPRRAWLALGLLSALACAALPASSVSAQAARLPECFGPGPSGSAAAFLGTAVRLSSEYESRLVARRGLPLAGAEPRRRRSWRCSASSAGAAASCRALRASACGRGPHGACHAGARRQRRPRCRPRPRPRSSWRTARTSCWRPKAPSRCSRTPTRDGSRCGAPPTSVAPSMDLEFTCTAGGAAQAMPRTQSTITLPECEGPWRVVARVEGTAAYPLGRVSFRPPHGAARLLRHRRGAARPAGAGLHAR